MKIEMKDRDGKTIHIGYEYVMDHDKGYEEPLFWIDTPEEAVTVEMGKKEMKKFLSVVQCLVDNL